MKYFVFILFLLLFFSSNGQNIRSYDVEMQAKHAELKGYDPVYRVNYFENIILKSEFNSDVSRLQFTNKLTNELVDLRPVATYQLGHTLDYKWISLGVTYTPEFLLKTNKNDELNNSKSYGLNLNFFFSDQWRQELGVTYYKGFIDDNAPDDFELYANASIAIIEGSTFFIANKNFSYRAHYAQTERQLKSAGSIIPRLRYSYTLSNPNIETEQADAFSNEIKSFDFQAQVGYYYSMVLNQKWFVTSGIHPGVGYNYSRYNYSAAEIKEESINNLSLIFNTELHLGYNNYRWFFGAIYDYRNYHLINNQRGGRSDSNYFSVYLGYRLDDNKPIRRFFGWFEDTFGF